MTLNELLNKIYEDGTALGACASFTRQTTLNGIVEMLFSAQGIEFCTKYRFPSIDVLREFNKYHIDEFNVFIDAGEITLTDVQRVFLIGDTTAHVRCAQTQNYSVCLMHGARATVDADGFAVVRIEKDKRSKIETHAHAHAKFLK